MRSIQRFNPIAAPLAMARRTPAMLGSTRGPRFGTISFAQFQPGFVFGYDLESPVTARYYRVVRVVRSGLNQVDDFESYPGMRQISLPEGPTPKRTVFEVVAKVEELKPGEKPGTLVPMKSRESTYWFDQYSKRHQHFDKVPVQETSADGQVITLLDPT